MRSLPLLVSRLARPAQRPAVAALLAAGLLATWAAPLAAGPNFWTSNGPYGGRVTSLVADPGDSQVLYASTWRGVYKSVDGGASWLSTAGGVLPSYSLFWDVAFAGTRLLATNGSLVYRSDDGAATWTEGDTSSFGVSVLVPDPVDPLVVYGADINRGVKKSIDSGQTWTAANVGLPSTYVVSLVLDPRDPMVLYAGTGRDGVYKSTDGAATWSASRDGLLLGASYPFVEELDFDPRSGGLGTLYASTGTGLYRSGDGGASWQRLGYAEGLTNAASRGVTFDAVDPDRVVVALSDGIFESLDGGLQWQPLSDPLPDYSIETFVANGPLGSVLFATGELGVFRSTDGGLTWEDRSFGILSTTVRKVAFGPFSPTLYAASNGGAYRSSDDGGSWSHINEGFSYAGAVSDILAHPGVAGSLLAAAAGTIYASADDGDTWALSNSGLFYSAGGLARDPLDANLIYAATGRGIYRSIDGGASWAVRGITQGAADIAIDPLTPSVLYAAVYQSPPGVYRSDDGGETWTVTGSLGSSDPFPLSLTVDPLIPTTVYVGTNRGVYKSVDSGASWQEKNDGIAANCLSSFVCYTESVAVNPANRNEIYAATRGGLFISSDAGTQWQLFGQNRGLPALEAQSVRFDPNDSNRILVGLYTGGLWEYTKTPPGIVVSSTAVEVSEPSQQRTVTVTLDSVPAADVVIDVTVTAGAPCVATPPQLLFSGLDPADLSRDVVIEAVDDPVAGGDRACAVVLEAAQSGDLDYDGLDADDIAVTVLDDDTASIDVAPQQLDLVADGPARSFTVSLGSTPTDPVTIQLLPDASHCELSQTTVQLGPALLGAEVTVQAAAKSSPAGASICNIALQPALSDDSSYAGMDPADVRVDVTTAASIAVAPLQLDLLAGGPAQSFDVSLGSIPSHPVVVEIRSDSAHCVPSTSSITLLPTQLEASVSVQVDGAAAPAGSSTCQIRLLSAQSDDGSYGGIDPDDVAVGVFAEPRIDVSPAQLDLVAGGPAASFDVALSYLPGGPVEIEVRSGAAHCAPSTDRLLLGPTKLQATVTVQADPSTSPAGTSSCRISLLPAQSTDPGYDGLDPTDVEVAVLTAASILVSPTELDLLAGGPQRSFEIALSNPTGAPVTVRLQSDEADCELLTDEVLLTSADPVATVELRAASSAAARGVSSCRIRALPAESAEPAYDGFDPDDVTARILFEWIFADGFESGDRTAWN